MGKLICFDKSILGTSTIKTYIGYYEQMPFDGMLLNAYFVHPNVVAAQPLANWTMSTYSIDTASLATSLSEAVTTAFRRFKRNYIYTSSTVTSPFPMMDWLGADVKAFINNMEAAAWFAEQAGFAGVFFNGEPDTSTGLKIWQYSDRTYASSASLAAYKDMVEEVGVEVIRRMENAYPHLTLTLAFGYEQVTKQPTVAEESQRYLLYGSFLNGLRRGKSEKSTFRSFYEDGYSHYLPADIYYDLGVQETLLHGSGAGPATDLVIGGDIKPGFASSVAMLGSANIGAAITLSHQIIVGDDGEGWVYSGDDAFFGASGPPDVAAAVITAIENARVTLTNDVAFDVDKIPGIIAHPAASDITTLSDTDPITSYTDDQDIAYTQTGGNRPTYSLDLTIPSILFTAASSQSLVCDGIATAFSGGAVMTRAPFTLSILGAVKTTGASYAWFGIGRSATTDPELTAKIAGTASPQSSRFSITNNAGGNATVTGATDTENTDIHVFTWIFNGDAISLRVDGSPNLVSSATVTAADYSTFTFNRARLGCSAKNTPALFMDAYLIEAIFSSKALGIDWIHQIEKYLAGVGGITVAGA